MADAPDSKSGDGNIVRVQVPPPAPYEKALMESNEIDYQRFLILHFSVKFSVVKYYHYTTTEHFIQTPAHRAVPSLGVSPAMSFLISYILHSLNEEDAPEFRCRDVSLILEKYSNAQPLLLQS